MNRRLLLKATLILCPILIFIGAFLNVSQISGANGVLLLGLLCSFAFAVVAAYEVWTSPLPIIEKILWTVILFGGGFIGAALYLFIGREKVAV
jgi:hypothetical protein